MPVDDQLSLSVIVTIVGGINALAQCLESLVGQSAGLGVEIIVPYNEEQHDIRHLRAIYPQVKFVRVAAQDPNRSRLPDSFTARHEFYDHAKSVGLRSAKGEILALVDSVVVAAPNWCCEVFRAHTLPNDVVGGAIEHHGNGVLNWATYFQDFGRYQLPLPEGPTSYLSDVNISYKRHTLESVRELWQKSYNEVIVNWALSKRGIILWQRPQVVVSIDRGRLTITDLLVERFMWGKIFGKMRVKGVSLRFRLTQLLFGPFIPIILFGRIARRVIAIHRNRLHFLKSSAALLILTVAWTLGEMIGIVTGASDSK